MLLITGRSFPPVLTADRKTAKLLTQPVGCEHSPVIGLGKPALFIAVQRCQQLTRGQSRARLGCDGEKRFLRESRLVRLELCGLVVGARPRVEGVAYRGKQSLVEGRLMLDVTQLLDGSKRSVRPVASG